MRKYFIILMAALLISGVSSLSFAAKKQQKAEPAPAQPVAEQPAEVKPVDLNLVLGDPEDSEMGILGLSFKNYITRASKGAINVKMEYSGGLDADETFSFHKVQIGKQDMSFGGIGNLSSMVPNLGVVNLPYIFPDQQAVIRGTTGDAAKLLQSYAEKAGLRILAWTYYGYRFVSNNKRPITTLKDIKGLKIRVPQSMVMIKTYRALGAIPSPLAWPMTRSALKNDLVDGQCYDYAGFRAMKFQEVGQKYIAETHFIYNLQVLVINDKLFNSLSKEDQKILTEAGSYIQDLSLQYQKEMNEMAKNALIAEGVHVSVIEDENEWRERAISLVWKEAADHVGGIDAINAYLKACDLPEWEPIAK